MSALYQVLAADCRWNVCLTSDRSPTLLQRFCTRTLLFSPNVHVESLPSLVWQWRIQDFPLGKNVCKNERIVSRWGRGGAGVGSKSVDLMELMLVHSMLTISNSYTCSPLTVTTTHIYPLHNTFYSHLPTPQHILLYPGSIPHIGYIT